MSAYRVAEVDAASRNLHDLLDVICEVQFELSPGKTDRRVDSLLWLARDIAEGIVAKLDDEGEANMRRARA